MSDFEVNDTGTRRALTETEIKMESIKAEARLIMDTYAESTVAHQAAKRMFDSLTDEPNGRNPLRRVSDKPKQRRS